MSASNRRRGRRGRPGGAPPYAERDDAVRSLARALLGSDPGEARIRRRTRDIARRLLRASPYAREPGFTRLHAADLAFLFAAYDARFLDGLCGRALGPDGVTFRLSGRMTRAGGKTTLLHGPDGAPRFEIAVSTSLLFDGFAEGDPEVSVCGLPCRHRLDALQRLFEHELVHLAEWLCWNESNCRAGRFRDIASRLFLHRAHTHRLITRSERAAALGIGVGTRVTFMHGGRRLQGRVNRITKRATVLVEDPEGTRWSDGRRYVRYYVPLGELDRSGSGLGPRPRGCGRTTSKHAPKAGAPMTRGRTSARGSARTDGSARGRAWDGTTGMARQPEPRMPDEGAA